MKIIKQIISENIKGIHYIVSHDDINYMRTYKDKIKWEMLDNQNIEDYGKVFFHGEYIIDGDYQDGSSEIENMFQKCLRLEKFKRILD